MSGKTNFRDRANSEQPSTRWHRSDILGARTFSLPEGHSDDDPDKVRHKTRRSASDKVVRPGRNGLHAREYNAIYKDNAAHIVSKKLPSQRLDDVNEDSEFSDIRHSHARYPHHGVQNSYDMDYNLVQNGKHSGDINISDGTMFHTDASMIHPVGNGIHGKSDEIYNHDLSSMQHSHPDTFAHRHSNHSLSDAEGQSRGKHHKTSGTKRPHSKSRKFSSNHDNGRRKSSKSSTTSSRSNSRASIDDDFRYIDKGQKSAPPPRCTKKRLTLVIGGVVLVVVVMLIAAAVVITQYTRNNEAATMPVLEIPDNLVEDQEPETPVKCSAHLGYPPGELQWFIKGRGVSNFLPVAGFTVENSGECGQIVTTSLYYTPTREANGSLLKCAVVGHTSKQSTELVAVQEIKMLPSLAMTSVIAYLNEGVTLLKCRLNYLGHTHWRNITVSKQLQDGDSYKILTVTRGGDTVVHESPMSGRVFTNVDDVRPYEAEVSMWIYVLTCGDKGTYTCSTDPELGIPVSAGTLQIYTKPEAPILSIPSAIVEGVGLSHPFTCSANVGHPVGNITILIKRPGETYFRDADFTVTSEREDRNCSTYIQRSFKIVPRLEDNGMQVRCEVGNLATLPLGYSLTTSATVHVVPVDPSRPCAPDKNGVYFPHPVLCNKFIWCVQGQEIIQHCPLGTLYINGGQCTFEPQRSMCYTDLNQAKWNT
ncbi:hypothetical protein MAR_013764 [Mya arenaria]|uniref:Chitin-binding type-2 domain-containing protein n=1 Tax=Mya arenaria TaxID=6604 RepID=A0ABY7G0T0_MYAAR|nr:hypothetical protein MAR_013764 [Mya arenaria]